MKNVDTDSGTLSEINVTPLVDVMLVLLIIFMVAVPVLQQGINLNLPKATAEQADVSKSFTITIDKAKKIWLEDEQIDLAVLEGKLFEKAFSNKRSYPVFIKADADLKYKEVVAVIDVVKKAGIEVIGIITEPDVK
jgi:biopolymer transport protein TolR